MLFIVPFYAIFSFLSLAAFSSRLYFETVRDIWEALVIYCFLVLVLSYCGGENACIVQIARDPGTISHPWPLHRTLPRIPLDARFLKLCKRWTIQFVFVKPFFAVTSIVLNAVGKYDSTAYQWILNSVYNVSYTAALYALFLFYLATRNHPGLADKRPVLKFLSVKMIVFATYYQSLVVQLFPVSEDALEKWISFILCIEMFFFAVLHIFAFRWQEFAAGAPGKERRLKTVIRNAKNVISVKDLVKDTLHNFSRKYGDHIILETEVEMRAESSDTGDRSDPKVADSSDINKPKTYRAKTYVLGNTNFDQGTLSRVAEGDLLDMEMDLGLGDVAVDASSDALTFERDGLSIL